MSIHSIYESKPWLKLYPKDCPSEIQLPEKSLTEAFDEAVTKFKNKTAITFYGTKLSYGDLGDHVNRLANAMKNLGFKKGDKVAFLLVNCPQFIIAFYATLKVGGIITPISPIYVSKEIKHQLADSDSKHVICQDILYDRIEKTGVSLDNVILTSIDEYLPSLKKLFGRNVLKSVYRDMEVPMQEIIKRQGIYKFKDLLQKYSPLRIQESVTNPKVDLALLPYTGGTTGLPKGVMLTHHNLLANSEIWNAFWSSVLKEGEETYMAIMPFYHIGGLEMAVINGILKGYTLIVFTTVDLDQVLNAIVDQDATIFGSVPSLYENLRKYEKLNLVNWKKLKVLFTGADTLLEETAINWSKKTGTDLYEVYGLTETSLGTHCSPKDAPKVGSFGVPLPSTMAAILHPERDEFLGLGETGEIAIRGPQVFQGYWRNEEETRSKFATLGGSEWFRTGDLGSMDSDGQFYFYDRKRDLIKYKGYAVFAREVEEVLVTHPKIREVGVVGVPDVNVGEIIKAVVVLEPEARGQLSEDEIIKFCEEKLAHYKIPKIIQFRGEIPKTDVGKVSRRELREE